MRWQRQSLRSLYGVRPSDGFRKYRKGYLSTAKQNGKSLLLGGLPLYHILMEDEIEMQPEAYGVASARDQAGIVFNAATMFIKNNPVLSRRLKVLETTKRIVRRDGGGLYAVLSAEGGVQDGKRPSLLMFDELHRFTRKSSEVVHSVLTKGMISRNQPLCIATTTSGDEYESPLWAGEYEYARHILDGSLVSETYYSQIYQADPQRIQTDKEYWKSRESRVAANPSHEDNGGFLKDSAIVEELNEAISKPEKFHDYIRLHLNVPMTDTESPVVNFALWCAGGGPDDLREWPTYDVELLIRKWGLMGDSGHARPCFVGVDLAWTTDFTGMSCLFPPVEQDPYWRVLFFAWLPEENLDLIQRITRAPLADWQRRGFLTVVPGKKINLLDIEKKIKWAHEMFGVRAMLFDPWGGMRHSADRLAQECEFECLDIGQTIPKLTGGTKEFLALYQTGSLVHANNPIMNWHVSCLSLASDENDNVKPRKPKRDVASKRIDLVSATINALSQAILAPDYSPASHVVEVW